MDMGDRPSRGRLSVDEEHTGPDRRQGTDRRSNVDRRVSVVERRGGLERRRGPGRRRSEDRRSAEEGEMSDEQFEFLKAIDEYKRVNNRPFPTWTEVLEVVKHLGYRKVAPVGEHIDKRIETDSGPVASQEEQNE